MNKITPSYLAEVPKGFSVQVPVVSVYANCIRFNKLAAALMNLPARVVIEQSDNTVWMAKTSEDDSFQIQVSGTWNDFVINDRKLVNYLFSHFKSKRTLHLHIQATMDKDFFTLNKIQ